jgi:hypothetical protein
VLGAVRERVNCELLTFQNSAVLDLSKARALSAIKPPGNSLTRKVDYFSSKQMKKYLNDEFGKRKKFKNYEVCDVGFWDANPSTDIGLGWHNDFNWNRLLSPHNISFHLH